MREWLEQLHELNRNLRDLVVVLRDLRKMLAPLLGWDVTEE